MVGAQRSVTISDGAGLSRDGGRRGLATEQSVHRKYGCPAGVDGYLPRNEHETLAEQERVVNRLLGVLAEPENISRLLDRHPAGTGAARRTTLDSDSPERAWVVRTTGAGRNRGRLARARYIPRCTRAPVQLLSGCFPVC